MLIAANPKASETPAGVHKVQSAYSLATCDATPDSHSSTFTSTVINYVDHRDSQLVTFHLTNMYDNDNNKPPQSFSSSLPLFEFYKLNH